MTEKSLPASVTGLAQIPYPSRNPDEVRVSVFRAQPGAIRRGRLPVAGLVPDLSPTIVLIGGTRPGPVMLITAGVHGAEVSSIQAARTLARTIDPQTLGGTVILVPILNVSAFRERRLYVTPLDGKNLNRTFPGQTRGTASQRLAHAISEFLPEVDLAVDLHGGDLVEALEPFIFVGDPSSSDPARAGDEGPGAGGHARVSPEAAHAEALRLARLTGFPQVIRGQIAGTLSQTALSLGKPAFIAEAGGQGVVDPGAVSLLVRAMRAILSDLGMLALPGDPTDSGPPPAVPAGDGHPEGSGTPILRPAWTWLESPQDGIWEASVHVGQEVRSGETLGTITDLLKDESAATITAPCDGRIVFVVTALSTTFGTPLLAIGAPGVAWP